MEIFFWPYNIQHLQNLMFWLLEWRYSLTAQVQPNAKWACISLTRDKIERNKRDWTKQELKIFALDVWQRITSKHTEYQVMSASHWSQGLQAIAEILP